ncbi:hypothetical protein LCGC14_3052980, partial [marine sediment metagenome]
TIAGMVPGLMGVALVAHNLKELEFGLKPPKKRKGKVSRNKNDNHIKRITKLGVTNLIAIPLIGAVGGAVNQL